MKNVKLLSNLWRRGTGALKYEYRNQLLASISVTLITLVHGIGIGWPSPMLLKLQSPEETPLNFVIDLQQASWVGAMICGGGMTGNLLFGYLLDRVGRKTCLYLLTFPNLCAWTLLYFAKSVEYLYVARFCAGVTGGAIYTVIPIFIGEVADSSVRGRLTSLFSLTLNTGILLGFILASHLPYHWIPCTVAIIPMIYGCSMTHFPETPQHLLRSDHEEQAMESLRFYKKWPHADVISKSDNEKFNEQFAELKLAVLKQKSKNVNLSCRDFCTKPALKAICTGIVLMVLNIFSGSFALINYMSSVFAASKTELHPDTNTIIIGVVQIIGTYMAIIMVDRYGRKILLLISTGGMGLGLAAFGLYAFFAQETDQNVNNLRLWLPLTMVAIIILLANIGMIPVCFVVLIEIMPVKIRSTATSICLTLLSAFAFLNLKIFPIFMHTFGLAATMWFCASFCAFGVFYIAVFIKETKGKSMDHDDDDDKNNHSDASGIVK